MSMAIHCLLHDEVPGIPLMEGKDLFVACIGSRCSPSAPKLFPTSNIVGVDFSQSGQQSSSPQNGPVTVESVFAPLEEFMFREPPVVDWHHPSDGLAAVRAVLEKLRSGTANLTAPPDMLPGNEEELTAGVIIDLEELEEILIAAKRAHTRFALVCDY
jgi:hypothetical protein